MIDGHHYDHGAPAIETNVFSLPTDVLVLDYRSCPIKGATKLLGSFYPPPVIVSFSIDDLKQSIPGVASLADSSQGANQLFTEVVSLLGIADWYDWTEADGGETPNQTPR